MQLTVWEMFFLGSFPKVTCNPLLQRGFGPSASDLALEGYCWGLDLRVKPSPSEMLPNLFAGPQRNGAKHTRRYRMNTKKHKLKNHDLRSEGYHLLRAEGSGWLPRSASAKHQNPRYEGYRFLRAKGDEELHRSTSPKTRTCGSGDQPRERRWRLTAR